MASSRRWLIGSPDIQEGIMKIINQVEGVSEEQRGRHDFELQYPNIHYVCSEGVDLPQSMEDRYGSVFKAYFEDSVFPALRNKHGEFMLRELVTLWKIQKKMVFCIGRCFCILDRRINLKSLPDLERVGFSLFRDLVLLEMLTNVKDAVCQLIDREREGGKIDRALLKDVFGILEENGITTMDQYENVFEACLLADTSSYYSRKAASWIQEDSFPEYMRKAEECLNREKELVNYLYVSSGKKIMDKIQTKLLAHYEPQLLEKEFLALLKDDKVDDLSRMYRIFSEFPKGFETITAVFCKHVRDEGNALVLQAEDVAKERRKKKDVTSAEETFLWDVVDLLNKYLKYVSDCFANHFDFDKALQDALEDSCNKGVGGSTIVELLASFWDNVLKKGGNGKWSDEAIEESFQKLAPLLAYISDKDMFAEFYRQKLARRLLFDRSVNDDRERNVLTKLKQQCGGQFTYKMEGMVTDLTLARDHQSSFVEFLSANQQHPGLDLSVTVLKTAFWPTYKFSNLLLPSEMVKCVEVFEEFYGTKTKHRKLSWMYCLGTCNIIGYFKARQIELVVTTYQASVLLLFNSAEQLSFNDIKTQLNLPEEDIVRTLHSLSCANYKLLKKLPEGKTVDPADSFLFNATFTNKVNKLKIPLPQMDEKKRVIEDIDKDRRFAIDAAIIRMMKSRRTLPHQQLVSECVEQLSKMFKPDLNMVKKRIEDLIFREYLERDKTNREIYKYLS